MRLGFVVHGGRPAAIEAAERLRTWASDRGIDTEELPVEPSPAPESAAIDLVVSVGGDGTLLRAALWGNRLDAPVLGVKVGHLGFLTEVEPEDAPAVLEDWRNGDAEVVDRMALVAEPDGQEWESQWALNEVIVEKRARHRVIRLATWVGDDYVTTFSADGVIVATPTGSTAYSFSARGPIVSPRLPSLVLTPVSAHMVFDRAIVLSPEEQVALEVHEDEPGLLSADGREGIELKPGARVTIRTADRPARLVRSKRAESFYSLLRRKFHLPADPEPRG
ncbi:MAG TPA: NAD(+)/NADH kinase [Actinomycetota bacterium]|nr:NAD(+)/NADH kinase [Actinomycetota bacterium]